MDGGMLASVPPRIFQQSDMEVFMVRREIKSFEIKYSQGEFNCEIPFTLSSISEMRGIDINELCKGITLSTDIYADSVALTIKNIYLRLREIDFPAEVYVNESKIGFIDGERLVNTFDIASALTVGNNKLELRTSPDICSDMLSIGITSPIEVIRFNNAIIDNVALSQKHKDGEVTIGVRVDMIGNTENVKAVITLVSATGQTYYAGLTRGKGTVTVKDPLYWWPKGCGVQNLYKVIVNLYGDVDVEDTFETRIGLRTVETTNSVDGTLITVNGVSFLPFGAVFYADPQSKPSVADKRTEALITSASMANYNALIVPLDSHRPHKKFYDLCDVHGIMVIEELDSIEEGTLDRLSRVSHHASLCLLDIIGSEKIEEIEEKLNLTVPELGFSISESAPIYPSYPSMPSIKTLYRAVPQNELNPFSRSIEELGEKGTIRKIILGIEESYPYPFCIEDFTYLSMLSSASKISKSVKERRLAQGDLGRAVFDTLGDSVLSISPSAIDHQARWKALHYHSAKFFAPVAVYADNNDGIITFSVSSQRRIDFAGGVEYRIADSKNRTVYKDFEPCEFGGITTKTLFTKDLSEYIKGHEREYYLEYMLRDGTSVIYRDVLLFVPEKHFKFENPGLTAEIVGSDKRYSLTITAESFVRNLEIDFVGADAVFAENYFDITSNAPLKIQFTVTSGTETSYHLKSALTLRSVYDTMK